MKNTNYFLWGITVLFLAACSTEELIPFQQFPPQSAQENEFANILLQSLKQQDGIWEHTRQQATGKTLLFDYTLLSTTKDFGLHFSVPYKAPSGNVEGCYIYPYQADNNAEMDQLNSQTRLGLPIDFNSKTLSEMPYERRYLYSAIFKKWRNKGLNILNDLTAFADSIDLAEEDKIKKQATRATIVNPEYQTTLGDKLFLKIDYNMTPGVGGSAHEWQVITLSKETMKEEIEHCIPSFFTNVDRQQIDIQADIKAIYIVIENSKYFTTNDHIEFMMPFFLEEIKNRFMKYRIKDFYYQYFYSIMFYNLPRPPLYIDDNKGSSGSGGGGGTSGSTSGNNGQGGANKTDSIKQQDDFIAKIFTSKRFINNVTELGLSYDEMMSNIKINIGRGNDSNDRNKQTYSSYQDNTNTLTIYMDKMIANNLTDDDQESSVFHECVHVKQHLIDGISFDRDENGIIIETDYEFHYTPYDVAYAYDTFGTVLDTNNIPEKGVRTAEQQSLYDMYFDIYVKSVEEGYKNKSTYIGQANKQLVQCEIEAYQQQLSFYADKMSAAYKAETIESSAIMNYRWKEIQNQ